MFSDPMRDPRDSPLPPTAEEVEAWASRERQRRQAWLAGPTEQERDEWARRHRRRAALGLAESRLAPSPEEISEWAEREHKRRQAWRAGPTDAEKREWARRHHRSSVMTSRESELSPTGEEVEAWANEERHRREAWVAGPTDAEKERWIRRQTAGVWQDVLRPIGIESEVVDAAQRFVREADLAAKGALDTLIRAPLAIWSYLVRSGRAFEDDVYQPPPRRRVRF